MCIYHAYQLQSLSRRKTLLPVQNTENNGFETKYRTGEGRLPSECVLLLLSYVLTARVVSLIWEWSWGWEDGGILNQLPAAWKPIVDAALKRSVFACFVLFCFVGWFVCLFVFNHATLWDVASSKPRPDIGQVITINNPCNIPFERSTSNVRFLCYAFVCK